LAEEGSPRAPIRPIRPRTTSPSAAEIELQRTHEAQLIASKLHLPTSLAWLEPRANLYYVAQIAELARRRGVALRLLYLPSYRGAAQPAQLAVYEKLGPVWYPPELLSDRALWFDVNHLNHDGALALASWLARCITEGMEGDARSRCGAVSQGAGLHRQQSILPTLE
jgi:hypothetical protein